MSKNELVFNPDIEYNQEDLDFLLFVNDKINEVPQAKELLNATVDNKVFRIRVLYNNQEKTLVYPISLLPLYKQNEINQCPSYIADSILLLHVLEYLPKHKQIKIVADDLTDYKVIMPLLKNKNRLLEYHFNPKTDNVKLEAVKALTILGNLKPNLLDIILPTELFKDNRNLFIDAILTSVHDFKHPLLLNTAKLILELSSCIIPDNKTQYLSLLSIEEAIDYINYDFSKEHSIIRNIRNFYYSIPLFLELCLNENDTTLVETRSKNNELVILDDTKDEYTVGKVFIDLLRDRDLFDKVFLYCRYASKEENIQICYYPSQMEDYIYQQKNLYAVLHSFGYFNDFDIEDKPISEGKLKDLDRIQSLGISN